MILSSAPLILFNALARMFEIVSFVGKVVFKLSCIDDFLAVLMNRSAGC